MFSQPVLLREVQLIGVHRQRVTRSLQVTLPLSGVPLRLIYGGRVAWRCFSVHNCLLGHCGERSRRSANERSNFTADIRQIVRQLAVVASYPTCFIEFRFRAARRLRDVFGLWPIGNFVLSVR